MNEIGEASAEPVELPDHKSVTFPECLEAISRVDGRAWVTSLIDSTDDLFQMVTSL